MGISLGGSFGGLITGFGLARAYPLRSGTPRWVRTSGVGPERTESP